MRHMTKAEFMLVMKIPPQWEELGMYPDELFALQCSRFEPSHTEGSEHDRNGMFHWWLKRSPSKKELLSLVQLSFLDPDQLMAGDVRQHIAKSGNADGEVLRAIASNA